MNTLQLSSLFVALGLSLGCNGGVFSENSAGKYKTKLESGLAHFDAGALPEALADFSAALAAAEKLNDDVKAGVALQNLATLSLRQGRTADAKAHAAKAAELLDKANGEDQFLVGAVNLQLGKAAMHRAEFASANQALDRTIGAFEKSPDSKGEMFDALLTKSMLLQVVGKHADAKAAYQKTLEFERGRRKAGEETHELAAVYCEMGRAAVDAGDYPAANQHLDRANKILRSLRMLNKEESSNTKPIEAWVACNVAWLLRHQNQPVKLAGVFADSIRTFEKHGRPGREMTFLHREFGKLLLDEKKLPESEVELKKALQLCHEFYGEEHPELARTLDVYAALLEATGRADQGAEHRAKAKAIMTALGQTKASETTKQQASAN